MYEKERNEGDSVVWGNIQRDLIHTCNHDDISLLVLFIFCRPCFRYFAGPGRN